MHEIGIASSIADIVRQAVDPGRIRAVRQIRVQIGVLRAVQPETLDFAFTAIVKDTDLEASKLESTVAPAPATCAECGGLTMLDSFPAECPSCGGVRLKIEGGMDLTVDSVVLDE